MLTTIQLTHKLQHYSSYVEERYSRPCCSIASQLLNIQQLCLQHSSSSCQRNISWRWPTYSSHVLQINPQAFHLQHSSHATTQQPFMPQHCQGKLRHNDATAAMLQTYSSHADNMRGAMLGQTQQLW
jgi:hypothetical protein